MTRRSLSEATTSPEEIASLRAERLATGTLEPLLMERHFGLRAAVEASAAKREARKPEHKAVAERIASGGRKPSYAPSLSNSLPEGKPSFGLFEHDGKVDDDWIAWGAPDIITARALAEAGYMPISEYVRMYAPGLIEDDGA